MIRFRKSRSYFFSPNGFLVTAALLLSSLPVDSMVRQDRMSEDRFNLPYDDLHVLSRSGDEPAKSARDGSIITFHAVRDFRQLVY